jgi:serine protease Do
MSNAPIFGRAVARTKGETMSFTANTLSARGRRSLLVAAVAVAVAAAPTIACHRPNAAQRCPQEVTLTSMETAKTPFPTPPVLAGTPDVATLVTAVKHSVVSIIATQEIHVKRDEMGTLDPFEYFFGVRPRHRGGGPGTPDEVLKRRGLGSGFIIDPQGHVVTNAHVVEDASSVRVTLADGRELDATVRGRDERLDLAVLEVHDGAAKENLPHAALGSSDALKVGEYVVAIGNPFGLGYTVTMGIVSAKSREIGAGPYDDFIQTDASINPGNSGGPLFNLKGEVVGINSAIAPAARGIGFAIPIDALKDVLPQLLAKGSVSRGRLGVSIQSMDPTLAKALGRDRTTGALVGDVERGGPAEKAGIRPGDVIENVDNTPVEHAHDLPRLIARHAPGSHVTLTVVTNKTPRQVDVTLDELKEAVANAPANQPNKTPSAAQKHDFGLEIGDDPRGGTIVRDVDPRSSAADQLEPGDAILEVNGAKVQNAREAADRMKATPPDRAALLKVRRGTEVRFVAVQRR